MPIIVKDADWGDEYQVCPDGIMQAVCYAVVDIGYQNNPFKPDSPMPKCVVLFETEHQMTDGRRFVLSNIYTQSLHEKSNLRKDLKTWRGKDFSDEELKGFDIEGLVGKNCTLNVMHEDKNGKIFAKITAIMPVQKNAEAMQPENTDIPAWVEKMKGQAVKVRDASKDAVPDKSTGDGLFF